MFLSFYCATMYLNKNLFQEFCEFRSRCGLLWCYDWVSIPMVYTQVNFLHSLNQLSGQCKFSNQMYIWYKNILTQEIYFYFFDVIQDNLGHVSISDFIQLFSNTGNALLWCSHEIIIFMISEYYEKLLSDTYAYTKLNL